MIAPAWTLPALDPLVDCPACGKDSCPGHCPSTFVHRHTAVPVPEPAGLEHGSFLAGRKENRP